MANPPPFYRLGMTDGAGKGSGSTEQTPIDLRQEGYEQGLVDGNPIGGTGAAGFLDAPTGTLTYGTVSPGDTETLNFTGSGGEFYAGRLVFSGVDPAYFQITQVNSQVRDTPFTCSSGDFIISFDEGSSVDIIFAVIYKDGEQAAMTVTVYDVDGSVVDTINATATVEDPVLSAVKANASYLGYWTGASLSAGAIANGDSVMRDLTNRQTPARDIEAVITGPAGWELVDSDPCGTAPSLSRILTTEYRGPVGGRPPTWTPDIGAYAAIKTAMDFAAAGGTEQNSGIVFVQMPVWDWPGYAGVWWSQFFDDGGSIAVPGSIGAYLKLGGSNGTGGPDLVFMAGNQFNIAGPDAVWISVAWEGLAGSTRNVFVQRVGQPFGELLSANDNFAAPRGTGLKFWNDESIIFGDTLKDEKHAGVALFSTNIGAAALGAIHDAASSLP